MGCQGQGAARGGTRTGGRYWGLEGVLVIKQIISLNNPDMFQNSATGDFTVSV